jgi:cyclase
MQINLRFLFALLLVSSGVFAADTPAAPDFTVKKVGDGVYAAITRDGGKSGSNAGFVVGEDGVAVIDSFVDVAPAQQLLAEIRKATSLPIRFVVNTHYHLDHTGGNKVFADAGAVIIAHRNLRGWLRTENLKFFGQNIKPEQKARVDALVLPQLTYDDVVDLYLGSRLLTVRFMKGHTGGDSVVFVPDSNVVFTGDLMWTKHLPNLIDASTEDWLHTLEKFQSDHPNATFIPGHGDVANISDVRDFHDYIATLRQDVGQAQQAGKADAELVNTVLPELKARYGTWGFFDHFAPLNIQHTAAELKGQKKIPVPVETKGK